MIRFSYVELDTRVRRPVLHPGVDGCEPDDPHDPQSGEVSQKPADLFATSLNANAR